MSMTTLLLVFFLAVIAPDELPLPEPRPPELPPLTDLVRFQHHGDTRQALNINIAYRDWLGLAWPTGMFVGDWQEDARLEALRAYYCWDALDDARKLDFPASRRQALQKLWDRLGAEDYATGRMPSPLPLQYLRRFGD